ncbi:ABC transporter permease [Lentilactobacillus raoultii]|uniref:ABC transporter permease n=1 Tax=Lentilactobacillus raoultii TaxID=1987503 RepID=A0ABW3PNV8_9LACO|nr:ABC transporter permease [Lentilactobacillus raoultii]
MITLVRQEIFKLVHKKSTWATSVLLLIIMTVFAVVSQSHPSTFEPKSMFIEQFTGFNWVVLFMIAASSSIISMEFQYGTIKELLYRKYYRGEVLISKWITMVLYSIYFIALVFVYSLILKFILFNNTFQLSETYGNKHSILLTALYTSLSGFVALWLILSLVLLIANLFKSSAAAISVGIIGYFAINVVSSILTIIIKKWTWLKWNPLNMMNYPNQVVSPDFKHLTLLSTNELLMGSLVYMVIFLAISYVVFKRRSV